MKLHREQENFTFSDFDLEFLEHARILAQLEGKTEWETFFLHLIGA